MAILDFLRKRDDEGASAPVTPEPSTETVTPQVDDVLLKAMFAGDEITRDQAMTIPAVSAAVDYISETVASMPVKLYRYKKSSRTVESLSDDPRVQLLNGDTGDTLDAFQMKKAFVADYLMGQGGYIYIQKNRNEVTALKYVPEDMIAASVLNEDPLHKSYKINTYGTECDLFQFIKLLRNTKNGAYGVGLTTEVSKALETAYSTLLFQLFGVKSGGNKKGFLKSDKKLDQKAIDTLKRAWRNLYSTNGENVVVLNNGLEFQEASHSSVEMQLDQNKKTLTDEIKNIFHIHDDDYYRTFKEAIYPIVKAFETALNKDLLLEKEKKNHFFELDVKEILRVNIKERYEAYKLAKETGFMTINEIRRAENMEGMDVINVGLAAVLYDTNNHVYYTPNVDKVTDPSDGKSGTMGSEPDEATQKEDQKLIQEDIGREEYAQEKEDGNVE